MSAVEFRAETALSVPWQRMMTCQQVDSLPNFARQIGTDRSRDLGRAIEPHYHVCNIPAYKQL